MTDFLAYLGLFAIAFGAASILPVQSEAVLIAMLVADYPALPVLIVASAGNVLGAVLNWGLGLYAETFKDRRWFPVSQQALARAQNWFGRFGVWSLLFSWMPFVGDPLTVAAGLMRVRLAVFLPIVTVAKTGRYIALWYLTASAL